MKTLALEMSKVPFPLRDDRLHASLCAMACSLIGLKPMNKPKHALSLSKGLRTQDSTNPVTFHSQY